MKTDEIIRNHIEDVHAEMQVAHDAFSNKMEFFIDFINHEDTLAFATRCLRQAMEEHNVPPEEIEWIKAQEDNEGWYFGPRCNLKHQFNEFKSYNEFKNRFDELLGVEGVFMVFMEHRILSAPE